MQINQINSVFSALSRLYLISVTVEIISFTTLLLNHFAD